VEYAAISGCRPEMPIEIFGAFVALRNPTDSRTHTSILTRTPSDPDSSSPKASHTHKHPPPAQIVDPNDAPGSSRRFKAAYLKLTRA